ncbi:MAG: capsid cement protein [Christensenellales bacterium]|jgi:hypothetical protein
MSYLNHAINPSPTICGEAAATIAAPALLAVKFDANGKFVLPSSGDPCIGIALANSEEVKGGDQLHVQIKDIGFWKTGAAVAAGAELAANAAGKAITATSGAFIMAIALEAASAADAIIKVQIVKAGYKSGGSVAPLTLAGLTDVAISNVAGGDAIVYDSSAQKYKNKALGLNDLSDVNITTPADSEKLTYDGTDSEWQNK